MSLTGSTTDGCNIVLSGLRLQPGDEVVTTDSEHFGLIGPLHASGARVVVVAAGARGDPGRGRAADATDRRLARDLDDGHDAAGGRAAGASGVPVLVGRRAVGRRDPGRLRAASTSTRSPARSGSAGRTGPARSSSPTPSGCGSRGPATSRRRATSPTGRSCRRTVRRASTRTGSDCRSSSGCSRRSIFAPSGRSSVPRRRPLRCRELLDAARRAACPAMRRSSPSGRPTARRRPRSSSGSPPRA